MSSRKNKPPLALDMDFAEAMRRFAKIDVSDVKTSSGKPDGKTKKDKS